MANRSFLSLGSNIGCKEAYLTEAIHLLNNDGKCAVKNISSLYETSAYGKQNQPDFLNVVLKIETDYTPKELFDRIKSIEVLTGRKKRERWSEREIDIDILLFNNELIETPALIIPHPGMIKRDFVLVPLLELDSELRHPATKILLKEYLKTIKENYILSKTKFNLLELSGGKL